MGPSWDHNWAVSSVDTPSNHVPSTSLLKASSLFLVPGPYNLCCIAALRSFKTAGCVLHSAPVIIFIMTHKTQGS
jgi:hypothetical protein